jgi:Crp-like helix-turn-helix domain
LVIAEHGSPAVKRTENDSGTANMLGARRAGVTEAAMKLQDAGLIRYRHGHIEVLDRPGAEQLVCECYAVVKREFDRLLPDLKVL